ncbi:DNA replication/repair protein RecF [Roseobacter sp. YSTF-M11]|uniref:DNA replication and repair protein RecF n=1 Tax=Roseobacter insulae TaxID=2859783 RepID=A0A9X1FSS2_9RHOB|nr:DNA replication/repair protein RecF [Roseobacter insulae]MBW4706916.1 DNA replication/repair protein RecF [Roseobacter insulae]
MTLALTSLTLSHFRSHKLGRMTLDSRPVAIYGPNGAGKTNVLEAVSLFSPGRGLRRASAEDMTRRPETLGWKITGVLQSLHQMHEIEIWSEAGAARQVRIDGKAAPQTALGRIARVLWLIPAMDRLWIEGAEGRRRFLDRMTLSFEPGHAEASLAYERAMRERNRLLKDMVRDPAWYSALENQMAETGITIDSNRRAALGQLAQAQEDATTAFPTAELTLLHADGELPQSQADLRATLADNRQRDMAAGRSLIGPHRADIRGVYRAKNVPAKDCSTGEQKALLVSLILANARALARDFGAPPLLLLDEVAAHLDADRRAALYDEIVSLGAQAWMTGTDPELFEALGPRAQYIHVSETGGVSQIAAQR